VSGRGRKATPAQELPSVVFDTRVLLRALLQGDGIALNLRQSWQLGRCRVLVNPGSARALMLALAHPGLGLSVSQQHELLADYLPYAQVLQTSMAASGRPGLLAPFEQLALALVQGAAARWLVSDSLALRARFARRATVAGSLPCELLTSEEFLAAL
jgi:uncharacterized protein